MIDHSPDAWTASEFTPVIKKAGYFINIKLEASKFYIDEQPEILRELLSVLALKVESSRIISILKKSCSEEFGELGLLPMQKGYLLKEQEGNVPDFS